MAPKQPTPEQAETLVCKVMTKELRALGANNPGIHNAYRAATELNTEKKLGLTRNHILNLLRTQAHSAAEPAIDNMLYEMSGTNVDKLIDQEIESIRKEEEDKPQLDPT